MEEGAGGEIAGELQGGLVAGPIEEAEDLPACSKGFGSLPLVVLTEKWVYSAAADLERSGRKRDAKRSARES